MNTSNVLTTKVEAFKLIARESLRMNLISPRLSRISSLEADIEFVNKQKDELAHSIKVEEYEISILDTDHPNYDKKLAKKEATLKDLNEDKGFDAQIEEFEKAITAQKEGIAKIESGETKVSSDELNDLVDSMIKQDALVQVK
jgi:hypothetical protein